MKIEDNDGINEIYLKVTIQDLEEENKNLKEMCGKLGEMNGKLGERVNNLEEENNRLKDNAMEDMKEITKLEQENRKLKEYQQRSQSADGEQIERLLGEKIKLEEENKNLKEEIRFLEECLDNKEKVNKNLREELEKIKSTYVYDAKQVRDIC